MAKKSVPLLERFERSYIPEPMSGCWLWTGSQTKGYGSIHIKGERNPGRAHVVSYRLFKGEVPPGMMVRHKCDVRACVNPDHLLLGTSRDNMDDAIARGRHTHGVIHARAKLDDEKVRLIRKDCRTEEVVAADYGVSQSTISNIRTRKRWKHVT